MKRGEIRQKTVREQEDKSNDGIVQAKRKEQRQERY